MAEFFIDVGKIKLTWQGNWSSSADYVVDDLVWYDDGSTVSTYICVAAHTNQGPSVTGIVDTGYWNLFAGGGLAGGLQPGGTATNQIQYRSGLALGAEAGFTFDPATDLLSVPSIAVTGSAAGSPAYDLDVTGTFRASSIWEGANQITYNISGPQVTSGTIDNARLPATITATTIASSAGFSVKTSGLMFDSTNDRVGIGTSVPAVRLDVKSIATATADDVVARFRSDHTNAFGTFIEVMPNTSQAQKSGVHLHKNSLRNEPVSLVNDGGVFTLSNADTSAPTVNMDLGGANKFMLTSALLQVNTPIRINGCFDEAVSNVTIASGVVDLDATTASVFTITRTEIISSMTVTLPANSRAVSITLVMTSNGSYSVSWPTNTKWASGTIPTMSTTSGRIDVVTLSTTNNGLSWAWFCWRIRFPMSPPIGFSKGVIFAAGSGGGGSNLGPLSWNYANNAALPQQSTGSIVAFVIAENVDSYRLDGNLLPGLSLGTNGAYELVLSGTTSAFGYAGNQVDEGGQYTLRASDFGSTFSFTITIDGETRDFTQRQIGSTLIAKQFESYGTPNASWSGLTSQQQDATQTITASTGGCNSGSQLLSNGGVSAVTVNANNGSYGDPCQGTYKRCFVYYTI